jgi:voltage-gated potassium channel
MKVEDFKAGFFIGQRKLFKILRRERIPLLVKSILVFAIVSSIFIIFLETRNQDSNIRTFFDAMWWSFVTMTTVGYGDHYPITVAGKIFGVFLMFSGIAISSFFTATIASIFVSRRLKEGRGLETVDSKQHLVICGWNKHTNQILTSIYHHDEFNFDQDVVLICDISEEQFYELQDRYPRVNLRFVRGDHSDDVVLKRARVHDAATVIILSEDEADANLADDKVILATLAIKSTNKKVKVIAELNYPHNVAHLQRANVDEIVVKGEFIGYLLGTATCSPGISEVVRELLNVGTGNGLLQVPIPVDLVGKNFRALFERFRNERSAIVLGVLTRVEAIGLDDILGSDSTSIDAFIAMAFERSGKEFFKSTRTGVESRINPPDDYVIKAQDYAIVVGNYARAQA